LLSSIKIWASFQLSPWKALSPYAYGYPWQLIYRSESKIGLSRLNFHSWCSGYNVEAYTNFNLQYLYLIFSYSVNGPVSGTAYNATAFIGCDRGKASLEQNTKIRYYIESWIKETIYILLRVFNRQIWRLIFLIFIFKKKSCIVLCLLWANY
jgi:hypothetical protein